MQGINGHGNLFFHPPSIVETRTPEDWCDFMYMKKHCSEQ
jgi:hypothetical protein